MINLQNIEKKKFYPKLRNNFNRKTTKIVTKKIDSILDIFLLFIYSLIQTFLQLKKIRR